MEHSHVCAMQKAPMNLGGANRAWAQRVLWMAVGALATVLVTSLLAQPAAPTMDLHPAEHLVHSDPSPVAVVVKKKPPSEFAPPPPAGTPIPPLTGAGGLPVHLIFDYDYARQSAFCVFESLFKNSPGNKIVAHVAHEVNFKKQFPADVGQAFEVRHLNHSRIFEGTPLQQWYTEGTYRKHQHWRQNLCNAARLGLLFKEGGIYMDLDYIVLRPLSTLGHNVVSVETDRNRHFMNNAFLAFEAGHPFLRACMEYMAKHFLEDLTRWGMNGPHLITRVYKEQCPIVPGKPRAPWCHTATVLPYELVSPFSYYQIKSLKTQQMSSFNGTGVELTVYRQHAVALHMWNKIVGTVGDAAEGSIFYDALQNGCPKVFATLKRLGQ